MMKWLIIIIKNINSNSNAFNSIYFISRVSVMIKDWNRYLNLGVQGQSENRGSVITPRNLGHCTLTKCITVVIHNGYYSVL